MQDYFMVTLTNGETLSFEFECNNINYDNPNVCVFTHIDKDSKKYRCLAIIPYNNIVKVTSHTENLEV